jgi:phosphoglycerate dehydrogenase-like enzyme
MTLHLRIELQHALSCWTAGERERALLASVPGWTVTLADAATPAAPCDALWCWHADASVRTRLPGLRWVATPAAGADYLHTADLVAAGLTVTTTHGFHGLAMAEHALGLVLALARRLHLAAGWTSAGRWWREELDGHCVDLAGATCVIAGYGAIGRAIAQRARAFGMSVIGLGRRARPADDLGVVTCGPEDHDAVLCQAQVLINVLPGTAATRNFLSAERIARLPRAAIVINLGRGSTVDEDALLHAACAGRLRAGLDVTQIEPLPAAHPLRHCPDVLITPHASAITDAYLLRAAHAMAAQMARFRDGAALLWQEHDGEDGALPL